MISTPLVPAKPAPLRLTALFAQATAGSLIALALVAASLWPRRHVMGLDRLPPLRLHAPEFWRIAAAAPAIQLHLAGVAIALLIGVVLLVGVKGTTAHRVLGWAWVLAMLTAAVSSLFIRVINHGQFSFIHLLSGWTILALPMGVAFARRHRVKLHARMMTGLFTGGLVLAGLLAFVPGRLMWNLLFG
ncbi:MAG TPA: hypothetical protein VGM25_04520 [Caulobacteraceae bacterium]|jgi:uncharacterized membrane protein